MDFAAAVDHLQRQLMDDEEQMSMFFLHLGRIVVDSIYDKYESAAHICNSNDINKWFPGTVISNRVDDGELLWYIKYDDGDSEEMSDLDIIQFLEKHEFEFVPEDALLNMDEDVDNFDESEPRGNKFLSPICKNYFEPLSDGVEDSEKEGVDSETEGDGEPLSNRDNEGSENDGETEGNESSEGYDDTSDEESLGSDGSEEEEDGMDGTDDEEGSEEK